MRLADTGTPAHIRVVYWEDRPRPGNQRLAGRHVMNAAASRMVCGVTADYDHCPQPLSSLMAWTSQADGKARRLRWQLAISLCWQL
jgi:hypothetical protein